MSKYETKTKVTPITVTDFIESVENETRRADAKTLVRVFKEVTGWKPRMWGPTIIGFGAYHYTYESGRTGEAPVVGFAIRGREIVIYLFMEGEEQEALLAQLGKYRNGKVCLYFKRLSDLDLPVLEQLVANSVAEVKRRYPANGDA